MTTPIDINAELRKLSFLYGRTRDTPLEEEDKAFGILGSCDGGEIYVGSFSGESPWERHPGGDELVHVLSGWATLTLVTDDGPVEHELVTGTLFVVPKGRWHRFHVEQSVTVMTVTPPPTEHNTSKNADALP